MPNVANMVKRIPKPSAILSDRLRPTCPAFCDELDGCILVIVIQILVLEDGRVGDGE